MRDQGGTLRAGAPRGWLDGSPSSSLAVFGDGEF